MPLLQLLGMADTAAVWRASPALYYAAFNELVDRVEAEHGPWPLADFDAKLVRRAIVCCRAGSCRTQQGELVANALRICGERLLDSIALLGGSLEPWGRDVTEE